MLRSHMRVVISFVIACAGCLAGALFAPPASAGIDGWTAIGPGNVVNPEGLRFAVDPAAPDTIYLASGDALLKTTDGGRHWAAVAGGFAVLPLNAIAIDPVDPATIYVAGGSPWDYGGFPIYKSIDGGVHWTAVSTDRPSAVIGIAPSLSSTLYAGENDVVVKSTDGGTSWTERGMGLTGFYISALAIDPRNPDVAYLGQQVVGRTDTGQIFKSADGGLHWTLIPLPVPGGSVITSLAIDPLTPSIVYASYAAYPNNGGVLKSIDSGATWVAARNGLSDAKAVRGLAIDPGAPARIFAATQNGVFMSTDGAASWTALNSGLPNVSLWSISIDRSGSILRAASDTGLFEYRFADSSSASVPVIEYFHAQFDHYFITSNADEIAKLDNGVFAGWARTGLQFNAYRTANANSVPVCRFFSTAFAPKSSHFYTPFAAECAIRQADPVWMLESADAFDIGVPAPDGSCAAGFMPVYRLYNNGQGGAPNHRYTTDATVRAQMIAQGWIPEGVGPNDVEMCSPP